MKFKMNIKVQMIALLLAVTLFTAGIISVFALTRLQDMALTRSEAAFIGETKLMASAMTSVIQGLENDSYILTQTPPFQGIINAYRNGGYDIEGNSTMEEWQQRLQQIFSSALAQRPYYRQMRYIADVEQGRELVRVDQNALGIHVVEEQVLQPKHQEFYYQQTLDLPPDTLYLSPITYNKEFGKITMDRTPTVRSVITVNDMYGKRFGLFVINLDARMLFADLLLSMEPQFDSYIVDSVGNSAWLDAGAISPEFVMANEVESFTAEAEFFLDSAGDSGLIFADIDGEEFIGHGESVAFGSAMNTLHLTIGQFAPAVDVFADARRARNDYLFVTGVIVAFSMLLALMAASYLTAPLTQLKESVVDYGRGVTQFALPTHRRDEVGDLAYAFKTAITGLAEARKREEAAHERLSSAIKSSVDAFITVNDVAEIVSINPVGCEIFDVSSDKVIGRHVSELVCGIDVISRVTVEGDGQQVHRHKSHAVIVAKGKKSSGGTFPIELSITDIKNHSLTEYMLVIRDLTERVEKEKQLQAANQELQLINGELNDFTYIASHDLREPLRGIQIHSQAVLKNLPAELDEKTGRKLSRINELAERMQQLVTDLLQYSRLNRMKVEGSAQSIENIVAEVLSSIELLRDERNVEVAVESKLPDSVGDKAYLTSVFMNLITNAIKYNDKNIPRIRIGHVAEKYKDDEIRTGVYYVADNGVGIEPEFQQEVFKIFKRLHSEAEFGYGTGAGLTFASKIIEQHGGIIWVESIPGEGSTFYFTLAGESNNDIA